MTLDRSRSGVRPIICQILFGKRLKAQRQTEALLQALGLRSLLLLSNRGHKLGIHLAVQGSQMGLAHTTPTQAWRDSTGRAITSTRRPPRDISHWRHQAPLPRVHGRWLALGRIVAPLQ